MKRLIVFIGALVFLSALAALSMALLFPGGHGINEARIAESPSLGTVVGDDNTLYLLSARNIRAVGADGRLEWSFPMPANRTICYGFDISTAPDRDGKLVSSVSNPRGLDVTSTNGTLYAYFKRIDGQEMTGNGALVAITDGAVAWELPLESRGMGDPNGLFMNDSDYVWTQYADATISARDGRVYVHHAYNETVLGADGTVLMNFENVSDPAAVDEEGFIYLVRPNRSQADDPRYGGVAPDHRDPSDTIDAYYPNGTLYWERRAAGPLARQPTGDATLPIYLNGTIYAPLHNGIVAFDRAGNVKWAKTYDLADFRFDGMLAFDGSPVPPCPDATGTLRLYSLMPFDRAGNVYLECVSYTEGGAVVGWSARFPMYVIAIGPDGREISRLYMDASRYSIAKDGVWYVTEAGSAGHSPANVTDLSPGRLAAYDVKSGRELWDRTFPATNRTVLVLDEARARAILGYNASDTYSYAPGDYRPVVSRGGLSVVPGNGTVYVIYRDMNYENPIVFGKSRLAYVYGIYALDTNGTPLWYVPIDPSYRGLELTQNGTFFYQTPDGRIGALGAGATAGLTLTALFAFYHFVLAGTVARARSRLGKNENRNRILGFVAANPGFTMYEIARGTGLNLGTVKYHMFILGLNHKTVSSRMDGKYIRYFTNSGTYGRDEQLVISLMRRDTIGRILGLILAKPGISNVEIARELDIQESVACRCVKELAGKDIITRRPEEARGAYSVRDDYSRLVEDTIGRLRGE